MGRWLKDHWLELLNTVIVAAGLAFTFIELRSANRNLGAANEYAIHKDAREMADQASGNPAFRRCLPAPDDPGTCPPADRALAVEQMAKIFNFYYSVYRLTESRGVTASFVGVYKRDFCQWFQPPAAPLASSVMDNVGRINGGAYEAMRGKWCGPALPGA